jgi:ubiquitin C-terminal hydrolase
MKNNKPVSINKTMSIKKGSILNDMTKDYEYNCTAMGYHFGGLFGGHYCAICKIKDNDTDKYVLYDDLSVNVINDEQVKKIFETNKDAYMLVYTLNKD